MTDYYLDPIGGNDANDGTSWALRKKSLNAFNNIAVASDHIRVAATHTDAIQTIPGSSFTTASGGSAYLQFSGDLGCKKIFVGHNLDSTTTTAYNTATISAVNIPYNIYNQSRNSFRISTMPPTANTKFCVINLSAAQDWSAYKTFLFWVGAPVTNFLSQTPDINSDVLRVKLCSDTLGDVVLQEWSITFPCRATGGGFWRHFVGAGNVLPSNVKSIAIYSGANVVSAVASSLTFFGAYVLKSNNIVAPGDYISPKIPGANRTFWDRIWYMELGETTPRIYGRGEWYDPNPSIEYEVLRHKPWTTPSDFSLVSSAYKLNGWDTSAMAVTFSNVTITGGHDPVTGAPDFGYTILDVSHMNGNTIAFYLIYTTTARNFNLRRLMLGGSGNENLTLVNYGTLSSTITQNVVNCHAVSGDLIYGSSTLLLGNGSVIQDCTFAGSSVTLNAPVINSYFSTFNRCTFNGASSFAYIINQQNWSKMAILNCRFYFCTNATFGDGGGTQDDNSPEWDLTGSKFYEIPTLNITDYGYLNDRVYDGLEFYGSSPNFTLGSGVTIQNMSVYGGSGWTVPTVTIEGNKSGIGTSTPVGMTANANYVKNLNVTMCSDFEAMGCNVEDSTIILQSSLTLTTTSGSGCFATYRNCTIGLNSDSGTPSQIAVYYPIHFYGCTIRRIRFRKADPSAKVQFIGGTYIGTGVIPFTDNVVNYQPPMGWLYHNVIFPNYNLDGLDSYYNTLPRYDQYGDLSGPNPYDNCLAISSANGNPTDTRLYWWGLTMKTSSSVIHTAGGKSWRCEFYRMMREGEIRHPIATVALKGNLVLTIKMYVYLVSNCSVYLCAERAQIGTGMAPIRITHGSSLDAWQLVTTTFTPTSDGVVQFYLTFSSPAAGRIMYIDDITFEQL